MFAADKRIDIFHANLIVRQHAHGFGKFAGVVVDPHGDHAREGNRQSRSLQSFYGFLWLIDNQPQNTEIAGIRDGNRPDIHICCGKRLRDLCKAAGLILHKNGNLLDLHTDSSFMV